MNTILRQGSRGPDVVELQRALNQHLRPSPNLNTNGVFGTRTRQAVFTVQSQNWLVQDGEVGACTWAILRQTERYEILHPVTLVPQQDQSACWLASTSMLLKTSLGRASVPASLLASDGGLLNDSELNDAANTKAFARHFGLHMHYPQTWSASGLAEVLRLGPVATHILWNVAGYVNGTGSSGHFAVIAGIRGDGTEEGTTLRIFDPWPPNRGSISSFGYLKLLNNNPAITYQLFQK